jgi:hypothetical protein
MLAKFFIERPVLANVIAILTMVLGAVAIFALPVAQYPPITPPTVQVSTRYPGANATTGRPVRSFTREATSPTMPSCRRRPLLKLSPLTCQIKKLRLTRPNRASFFA